MVKSGIFIISSLILTLQLTSAFPHQLNSLNAIESDDVQSKELLHRNIETKSSSAEFRHLLQPVTKITLDIIQEHSSTLILETATFLDNLIVELNLLSESNESIEKLIPELTSLLDRMEKLNLNDDSAPSLHEKAAILRVVAKIFRDFDNTVNSSEESSDNSESAALKEVLEKLELNELNERINKSASKAVARFTEALEPFWNSLSETHKQEHEDLVEWHEHFVSSETDQDKLKTLVEFLTILRNIYLASEN